MAPNILVIGATGVVGVELVNRLAHIGTQVRAAIHDPLKLQTLFHYPSIDSVHFDFDDQHSIADALKGIKNLFIIAPALEHMASYIDNCLKKARDASVTHVAFLSVLGTDDPKAPKLAQWYKEAEYLIKNSTIPFTILRSNCLMQNVLNYLQPDNPMIYLPAGDGVVSIIDARDVAAVAGDLFLPGAHHIGKIYSLSGSRSYSMFQVADILSRVIGQRIGYVNSSKESASFSLKGKIADWRLDALIEYINYLFSGAGAPVFSTVEQIAGIEPVSFIDFARDYAQTVRSLVGHQL